MFWFVDQVFQDTMSFELIRMCHAQGKVVYYVQLIVKLLGMGGAMDRLANASSLAQQRAAWDSAWFVRFCSQSPAWLVDGATRILALLAFNRFVMWYASPPLRGHWAALLA